MIRKQSPNYVALLYPHAPARFFLKSALVFAFLFICALAGYIIGGEPIQCATIASVVKVAGMCEPTHKIHLEAYR